MLFTDKLRFLDHKGLQLQLELTHFFHVKLRQYCLNVNHVRKYKFLPQISK